MLTEGEQKLAQLHPYGANLPAWLHSNCTNDLRLLTGQTGQTLKDAQKWAEGKRLSNHNYQFLRHPRC